MSTNAAVRATKVAGGWSHPLWGGSIALEPPTGPCRFDEEPIRASTPIGSQPSSSSTVDRATHIRPLRVILRGELYQTDGPANVSVFYWNTSFSRSPLS